MIAINMPGGAIEYVNPNDLLWMRHAFSSEWKGAVMIRIGGDRLYSAESLDELGEKFTAEKVPIATFTPPEGRLKLRVNAKNVREIETGNGLVYPDKARAVLVFSAKVKLAVRETPKEASDLIKRVMA